MPFSTYQFLGEGLVCVTPGSGSNTYCPCGRRVTFLGVSRHGPNGRRSLSSTSNEFSGRLLRIRFCSLVVVIGNVFPRLCHTRVHDRGMTDYMVPAKMSLHNKTFWVEIETLSGDNCKRYHKTQWRREKWILLVSSWGREVGWIGRFYCHLSYRTTQDTG